MRKCRWRAKPTQTDPPLAPAARGGAPSDEGGRGERSDVGRGCPAETALSSRGDAFVAKCRCPAWRAGLPHLGRGRRLPRLRLALQKGMPATRWSAVATSALVDELPLTYVSVPPPSGCQPHWSTSASGIRPPVQVPYSVADPGPQPTWSQRHFVALTREINTNTLPYFGCPVLLPSHPRFPLTTAMTIAGTVFGTPAVRLLRATLNSPRSGGNLRHTPMGRGRPRPGRHAAAARGRCRWVSRHGTCASSPERRELVGWRPCGQRVRGEWVGKSACDECVGQEMVGGDVP